MHCCARQVDRVMPMDFIRKAKMSDLARIAEIQIFNFRLYFYPIFLDDGYYFGELQVPALMKHYESLLDQLLVYDDGVVKGFAHIAGTELKKLYVEPILHGSSIGAKLLEYAMSECGIDHLWALEQNHRAIAFYERYGFRLTGDRMPEDGTEKYIVLMKH